MKTLVAKNTWFNDSDLRLDSTFHLSDTNKIKLLLKNAPYSTTTIHKQSEDIFSGNIFKRIYVSNPEKGVPYITGSDMIKSDIDSGKFISKKQANSLKRLMLRRNWILVSCSGTLGNTVYTNELFENRIATHDLIRIIPNNKEVLSGVLYAYLSSKYGYALLTQSSYGGVIKHIEPHHIENIPVPVFPKGKQEEIHKLITEAAELRVEANRLLEEAVNYFDGIYVQDIKSTTKVFTKNVKDISFSWAAYNNNKECSDIIEKIGHDSFKVGDVAESIFAPPMFKHIYLDKDNGNPFLTGAELTRLNPKYYRWLSSKGVKNIEDYKVQKGTLLLYKSGTTDGGILGNVFIVDDNLHGACLSDHVIRIQIKDIKLSYWIYAFFKSKAAVKLLRCLATGTMIPFITPERLSDIIIPNPNEEYDLLSDKISCFLEKRVLANNKENQAIELVEKEIESWQQS
ncbi:MAG: methylation-associated defense system restriction endonuclease subunit S MAD5 [Dysgonomonas sp.]